MPDNDRDYASLWDMVQAKTGLLKGHLRRDNR